MGYIEPGHGAKGRQIWLNTDTDADVDDLYKYTRGAVLDLGGDLGAKSRFSNKESRSLQQGKHPFFSHLDY